MGDNLIVDLINRMAGSVESQERARLQNQGAMITSIEALAKSGDRDNALEDPIWEKNLKTVGLDPAIMQGYRKVAAEGRGIAQFLGGLQQSAMHQLTSPPIDAETGQMTDLGKTIPLVEDPNVPGSFSNPRNPFGGIFSPPGMDEVLARAADQPDLLPLILGGKQASRGKGGGFGDKANLKAARLGWSPDDLRADPGKAGHVEDLLKLDEIGLASGKATVGERAKYEVGQEPSGMGGTRVGKKAYDTSAGSGTGRAQTGEQAIDSQAGAVGAVTALKELGLRASRIAPYAEGLAPRAIAKGSQALQSLAGNEDITVYNSLRKRMGSVFATVEQGSRPSDKDVEIFVDTIPDPSLPLKTQIETMQKNYAILYESTKAEMLARGFDANKIQLPHPSEVPSWYGAISDGQGNYIFQSQ